MSNSDPSQPFEGDDIIYTAEAQARLSYLKQQITNRNLMGEPDEDGLVDEYRALLTFRQKCLTRWGQEAWDRGLSLIAGSYWDTYAQDQAEDIYGEAAGTPYWNAKLWAKDLRQPHVSVRFGGDTYWGDGQR